MLAAIGVANVVHPIAAITISSEGLRVNRHLYRWVDVERLELRGTVGNPWFRLEARPGRRGKVRNGWASQRLMTGRCSLASAVREVADLHAIGLIDDRRRMPVWERAVWTPGILVAGTVVLFMSLRLVVPVVWADGPGRAVDAHSRLRAGGFDSARGQVLVLSVRGEPASLLDLLAARLDRTTKLTWTKSWPPNGSTSDPAEDANATRAAIAAGLSCVGRAMPISGGEAEVGDVLASSPAAGKVHRHERIISVAGSPVKFKEDVYAALAGWDVTVPVPVELESEAGTSRTEYLQAITLYSGEQILSGVEIRRRTVVLDRSDPDRRLSFDFSDMTGDSSGLAAAITVADSTSLAPLVVPGRTVAMTGSISPNGLVGPIGGIEYKMTVALRAHASLVLVPASQLGAAVKAAGPRLRVVGVRTLTEAVTALGGHGCSYAVNP